MCPLDLKRRTPGSCLISSQYDPPNPTDPRHSPRVSSESRPNLTERSHRANRRSTAERPGWTSAIEEKVKVMATNYHAEHVGSLLRPPELLTARAAHARGEITVARLREVEDEAALAAIDVQRQAGIQIFTDGE